MTYVQQYARSLPACQPERLNRSERAMPGFSPRRTYSSTPFNYINGGWQRPNVDAIPEKSRKFLKFLASLPRMHRQSSIGAAKLWKSNRSFQLLKHHYAMHVDECKPKKEMRLIRFLLALSP